MIIVSWLNGSENFSVHWRWRQQEPDVLLLLMFVYLNYTAPTKYIAAVLIQSHGFVCIQAMECESSGPSVSRTNPPPPPSQDEEDGWTVVRKKKWGWGAVINWWSQKEASDLWPQIRTVCEPETDGVFLVQDELWRVPPYARICSCFILKMFKMMTCLVWRHCKEHINWR